MTFSQNIDEFFYLCSPLKMELSYDERRKEFIYAPVLDSIFDIAWFALYRIAISGAHSAIDYKRTFRTIQCRACGRTVVATGNNQLYCNEVECQSFRRAKNKRDERARKKRSIKVEVIWVRTFNLNKKFECFSLNIIILYYSER